MNDGYRVLWTDHALDELSTTVEYLQQNFTDREIRNLSEKIESTLRLASANPKLFPEVEERIGVRRVVIARFNTMYYRVTNNQIEILSFFSNRQAPEKRKF